MNGLGWQGTASIIVPTYNERGNVAALVQRLDAVLPSDRAEIIFVDDSNDGTGDAVLAAAETASIPVRLLHRPPHDRVGGLGGAVLRGLEAATGDWAVVMDGDLQHPPESVPHLLMAKEREGTDAVVASRYVTGGNATGLADAWRRWVSTGAGRLAKLLFPRALRDCTDPMSGFFAVRRAALVSVGLRPDGFKILLEILARAGTLRVREVPFAFAERLAGDSKAGIGQGLVYLRHLVRLRASGTPGRLAGFLVVGASGLIPNLGAMILLQRAGVQYLVATVLAALLAISWNFVLSDVLIFRGRRTGRLAQRYAGYLGLNALDIVLRLPLMGLLVGLLHLGTIFSTLICTVLISTVRFAALDRFLYRQVRTVAPAYSEAPTVVLDIREAA